MDLILVHMMGLSDFVNNYLVLLDYAIGEELTTYLFVFFLIIIIKFSFFIQYLEIL